MNDKERVKRIYDWLKEQRIVLSYDELSEKIGYTKFAISRNINPDGDKKTTQKFIKKLCSIDGRLNVEWALNGTGDMLLERVENDRLNEKLIITKSNAREYMMNILNVTVAPLVGQYAQAGYLRGFSDPEYLDNQPYYVAATKHSGGNYIAFEIRGDSMVDGSRDAIYEGDVVLGRELIKEYWKSKLHIPNIFIIVHKEEGIIIKNIIAHNVSKGIITCRSLNPNKAIYPDFDVDLRDVQQLFYKKELRRL